MTGIADTGFLVAFANRRDQHFEWACSLAVDITEPLITCEAVIAETSFHLRDVALVMEMIETGLIRIAFDVSANQTEIATLARRYADRRPDFADLCLIRLSELNPKLPILTVDRDFLVYRKNHRQVIPVIMPPEK